MSTSGEETSSQSPLEITEEQRTEWKNILEHAKINKAHQARIAQLAFATNIKNRIGKLPQDN